MKYFLPLLFIFLTFQISAQKDSSFSATDSSALYSANEILYNRVENVESLDSGQWVLEENWIYSLEDKPEFSKRDFDDRQWKKINSLLFEKDVETSGFKGFGWFRIHFTFERTARDFPVGLKIIQEGASEIWLDGRLVKKFGSVSTNEEKEERYDPQFEPLEIEQEQGKIHVLAIRYSNFNYEHSYDSRGAKSAGFIVTLEPSEQLNEKMRSDILTSSVIGIGFFVFYFTLGLVHLLMYLFYRKQRSNFFYSIFMFLLGYYFLHILLSNTLTNPSTKDWLNLFVVISIPLFFVSLLSVLYSFFYEKRPKISWVFIITGIVCSVLATLQMEIGMMIGALYTLGSTAEAIRIIIVAIKKKKKGCWVIGMGFGLFILFLIVVIMMAVTVGTVNANMDSAAGEILLIFFMVALVSIPLSMSIYFAWDFAGTNKSLQKKLEEIEELNAKNIEHEKEKQRILEKQKETLEVQVTERTKELHEQKLELEEKNKSITDSINYASRIQRSLLPNEKIMERELKKLKR